MKHILMIKSAHFIAALAGLIMLSACAAAPARDADKYYDLRPVIEPISFGSAKSLAVQSVSVKGLQSARPLIALQNDAPIQFGEIRGHLWHVAPSTLWQRAIADSLADASQDLKIGTTDTVDDEDYRLKVTVTQFHFVPSQKAIIDFEAILKNSRGKIVTVKRYQAEQPLAGADIGDAVIALQEASSAAITQLAQDLKAAL